MPPKLITFLALFSIITDGIVAQVQVNDNKPWRLDEAMGTSDSFSFSGHQRTRLETLHGQFRAGRRNDEKILAFRTALQMDVDFEEFAFTAELMDSRQALADGETPLGTSIVNTMELIQGYVVFNFSDLVEQGSKSRLQIGRLTMDIGNRRLVARNRFRNTVNNFTGINYSWTSGEGHLVQAFYVLPIQRLPTDAASLLDNRARIDAENSRVRFWGLRTVVTKWISNISSELYLYGLDEDDSVELATRNRQLYTAGFRLFRDSARGQFDFELESTLQRGESRASRSTTDITDLDHRAHHLHFHAGYTFDNDWSPRFLFQFDYARGDKNPNDSENNRFDKLYGARRFEYGPSGSYGAFARSNIISPAYRLILTPRKNLNIMFAHRFHWLASDTDAWTTAGLRDVTGNSGSYLGNQPEIRIRWDVLPGNLRIEPGIVHLFAGEFIKTAPNSNGQGDSTYVYLQTVFTF